METKMKITDYVDYLEKQLLSITDYMKKIEEKINSNDYPHIVNSDIKDIINDYKNKVKK